MMLSEKVCRILYMQGIQFCAEVLASENVTVPASGKLTVRVRPFNGTRRAARASAGYWGQENFCYFGKLLTFVGVIHFNCLLIIT